jgi:hypothetical protein
MIALNNENETSRDVYLPGTWIDYQTRPFETGDRAAWEKLPTSFNFSEMTNAFSAPPWACVAGYSLEQADRITGQVRQRGRDDAALRRARLRGERGSVFDVTGFQPFLEHHLVREDMVEHPFVADVVEAAFDVAFQHPLRRTAPAQCIEALLERVGSGAFRSEAIGVGIGGGLRDGFHASKYNACMARSFIVGMPAY